MNVYYLLKTNMSNLGIVIIMVNSQLINLDIEKDYHKIQNIH